MAGKSKAQAGALINALSAQAVVKGASMAEQPDGSYWVYAEASGPVLTSQIESLANANGWTGYSNAAIFT